MGSVTGVWLNMCSLKHGQRSLTCDGAPALIGVDHQHSECPLSEPTPSQILFSEAWLFGVQTRYRGLLHPRLCRHRTANISPERCPFFIRCVIGFSRNDIQREALGNRNPMLLIEKERFHKNITAN